MEHRRTSNDHVLVTRDGPIVTLTFNRPEARNAMTWEMYQRLYDTCEEVDADDSVRVLVLKGAGGKAFVAGTDISQFTEFKSGEDGLRYERDGDQRSGRIARVKKPVIAQIQGFAVGGGFGIAAGADLRIATPDARFGAPIARTLGNCLSMRPTRATSTCSGLAPEGADLHRAPDAGRRSARRRLRARDRGRRRHRSARARTRRRPSPRTHRSRCGSPRKRCAASRSRARCPTATT